MTQQIARGTYVEMVWFHEVPQDAFDLLPCKVSATGSKTLKVRGVELVFFRVGHGTKGSPGATGRNQPKETATTTGQIVCPACGGSGGGPQGPGQPDSPICPHCNGQGSWPGEIEELP